MSGGISVTVTCKDVEARVSVGATDTVQDLMGNFAEESKTNVDDATGVFLGDAELDVTATISDVGLTSGARVVIRTPVSSGLRARGFNFSSMSLDAAKKLQFSTSAPRYRWCTNGLNLEGVCRNAACAAKDQQVIVRLGMGTFNINKEIFDKKCPAVRCVAVANSYGRVFSMQIMHVFCAVMSTSRASVQCRLGA